LKRYIKKNKLSIYLLILTSIFLFGTAAVCNQCATKPDGQITEGEGKEVEQEEIIEEETRSEFEWFQIGNTQPLTQIQHKSSKELEDNRIGQMVSLKADIHTNQHADGLVDHNDNLGLKRIRLTIDGFDWTDLESIGTYSEYSIAPYHDRTITGLADKGIKITYTIVFWDETIQVEKEDYSRFKTEDEIQSYLEYVQFIVHQFKDRIEYYEILNEPSIRKGTPQYVEVADYINLVKRTVPVIRQEYPEAKIVVGAMSPLVEIDNYEYFFSILNSDIMPLVDAISWHVGAPSPDYEYWQEYYYNYPSLLQEIRNVASEHGFIGEFIADEHNWRTPETSHLHEPWAYSEIVSAKYYARGMVIHLGMDITVGLAGVSHIMDLPRMIVFRNLCTIVAGAKPVDLAVEIQSEENNIANYNFSLSDGGNLIALWNNDIAVDEDSGVEATIIIHDYPNLNVRGVDILEGTQQTLVVMEENNNLIIKDLIVRDYPIILHIK